jgi:hypothetical protein
VSSYNDQTNQRKEHSTVKFLNAVTTIVNAYQEANEGIPSDPFEIQQLDGKFNLFIQVFSTSGSPIEVVPLGAVEPSEEAEGEYEITECDWCPSLVTTSYPPEDMMNWMDRRNVEVRRVALYRTRNPLHQVTFDDPKGARCQSVGSSLLEAVNAAMRGRYTPYEEDSDDC